MPRRAPGADSLWRRIAWFAALWAGGVGTAGVVALMVRLALDLAR